MSLDPLIVNAMQHSVLTDGYAMAITMLVALVAQPAIGLKKTCRLMLRQPETPGSWQTPGVPDAEAGEWPSDVVVSLATMINRLTREDEDERMALQDALQQLEMILDTHDENAAGAPGSVGATPAEATPFEERACVVCDDAPREVRFRCGHACCCAFCASLIGERNGGCPICRAPSHPLLAVGEHLREAPTFEMPHAGLRVTHAS